MRFSSPSGLTKVYKLDNLSECLAAISAASDSSYTLSIIIMNAQAAVVILQSINEFTVNSTSARDLINDATLTNVAQQGYVSVH